MKKKILFLFVALLIPLTVALEFYPSTLEFSLQPNEVACKTIYFQLDSPAKVTDIWASSSEEPWSITDFQTPSITHKLVLTYQKELTTEKEIQVCLSGSQPGNYKGAILIRQEEVGNSVVQFAVWLKVSIEGQTTPEPEEQEDSGSSRSRNSGKTISNVQPTQESAQTNFQTLGFSLPEEKIKLNQPVKTKEQIPISYFLIIPAALIALLIILLFIKLIK